MTRQAQGEQEPTEARAERDGVALCLSGGGYRAMLFHAGSLLRLNELGWLPRLDFVSSVSGGSIVASRLAVVWRNLSWHGDVASNLQSLLVQPLQELASRTLDVSCLLIGGASPNSSPTLRLAKSYGERLLGDVSLQDLPSEPRFIFNTTNMQTGALMRFSKPYMRDWTVGAVAEPRLPLAQVVAASSAFPPFLPPLRLTLHSETWQNQTELGDEFRHTLLLGDGGIYDNLGLEPVIKRCALLLVSDGGGKLVRKPWIHSNWYSQMRRVLGIIDQQVRNLRMRDLIDAFQRDFDGCYWGIRTPYERYVISERLDCPGAVTNELAELPTRLRRLPVDVQQKLINWGYASADASLRQYVMETASAPASFPFASNL